MHKGTVSNLGVFKPKTNIKLRGMTLQDDLKSENKKILLHKKKKKVKIRK